MSDTYLVWRKPNTWHRPEPRPIHPVWHAIGAIVIPVYLPVLILNAIGRATARPLSPHTADGPATARGLSYANLAHS